MKETYTGLQILRFAAAMLVAVMHVTQAIAIHITGQGGDAYWTAGSAGVDVFFVISGFVMMVSTAHLPTTYPERVEAGWVFVKRRIVRIVPLYWFYTLLKVALLLAVPALAARTTLEAGHVAASFAFIPAMAPWGLVEPFLPVGWTLNFEMLFYLAFALAIALAAARLRFTFAVFLLPFALHPVLPESVVLGFYASAMVFEFLLGVAIAQAMLRWGPQNEVVATVLVLAGFAAILGLAPDSGYGRLLPWGVAAAAIVLGTVWLERSIEGAPLTRPLAFLGDASYSLYLSHPFVIPAVVLALKGLGVTDPVAIFTLSCLAVIAAGCASYVWLEKPLIAMARRLLFRPAPVLVAHAAHPASK